MLQDHPLRRVLIVSLALVGVLVAGGCARERGAGDLSAATYARYAVACDDGQASAAGARVLALGGNAVDAAVAASFALSVVRPHSCGLGGGGFMVIRLVDDPSTEAPGDAIDVVIDYRERAPGAVGPEHFVDLPADAGRYSGHAVGVPGTAAGLLEAHERYGVLPLGAVIAPALRLAREGYTVDDNSAGAIDDLASAIDGRTRPGDDWLRATYVHRSDDRVVNPAQAALLERIAREGRDAFYTGDNARHIINAVRAHGGVMTLDDLAAYEPVVTRPIRHDVTLKDRTFTLLTMPPPSSGGVATIQTLGMLAIYDRQMRGHVGHGVLDAAHPHDPGFAHALVECMKHAFADRARYMADTEFVDVPIAAMLNEALWERAVTKLNPHYTLPTSAYGVAPPPETDGAIPDDHGTSHLCVIDRWGNAVACTETINLIFGSRIAVPELGIVLNNEMDDFLTRPGEGNYFGLTQARDNLPGPGKRPLSSMSPTIVLDGAGEVIAVAGASGGPRIITGALQALLNALHFGMPARDAVATPRLHHQWRPDAVYVETWRAGYPAGTIEALASIGHEIREREDVGVVQLLVRRDGVIEAASDPRKGGAPAGE